MNEKNKRDKTDNFMGYQHRHPNNINVIMMSFWGATLRTSEQNKSQIQTKSHQQKYQRQY